MLWLVTNLLKVVCHIKAPGGRWNVYVLIVLLIQYHLENCNADEMTSPMNQPNQLQSDFFYLSDSCFNYQTALSLFVCLHIWSKLIKVGFAV